jgi:hypothetical protein
MVLSFHGGSAVNVIYQENPNLQTDLQFNLSVGRH